MRANDKSKREKDEIRKRLASEYGDGCLLCLTMDGKEYRRKYGKELDIHHFDENPNNWEYGNLCLAHHGCNCRETPRGLGKFNPVRFTDTLKSLNLNERRSVIYNNINIDESGLRITSLAEYKNHNLKPIAEREFERIIDESGEVEQEELLDAMFNISGLTQQACRNYVKAKINPHNGQYERIKKEVNGETKKYIRRRTK